MAHVSWLEGGKLSRADSRVEWDARLQHRVVRREAEDDARRSHCSRANRGGSRRRRSWLGRRAAGRLRPLLSLDHLERLPVRAETTRAEGPTRRCTQKTDATMVGSGGLRCHPARLMNNKDLPCEGPGEPSLITDAAPHDSRTSRRSLGEATGYPTTFSHAASTSSGCHPSSGSLMGRAVLLLTLPLRDAPPHSRAPRDSRTSRRVFPAQGAHAPEGEGLRARTRGIALVVRGLGRRCCSS